MALHPLVGEDGEGQSFLEIGGNPEGVAGAHPALRKAVTEPGEKELVEGPASAHVESRGGFLARELGMPSRIVDKPPSAGLWAGQTDESEMGLTYAHLDAFLRGGEVPAEVRARIEALRDASAHKRALPKVAPLPDAD